MYIQRSLQNGRDALISGFSNRVFVQPIFGRLTRARLRHVGRIESALIFFGIRNYRSQLGVDNTHNSELTESLLLLVNCPGLCLQSPNRQPCPFDKIPTDNILDRLYEPRFTLTHPLCKAVTEAVTKIIAVSRLFWQAIFRHSQSDPAELANKAREGRTHYLFSVYVGQIRSLN
jgi:hypothetical protein